MLYGLLILLAVTVTLVTASPYTRWYELEAKDYNHDMYMVEYRKLYATEAERLYRKRIFERRLIDIKAHNKKNLSWKEGVNKFTDRTQNELQEMNGYLGDKLPKRDPHRQHVRTGKVIPEMVDYRQKPGVLTAVKDQGQCGSCWAVSSASTIESHWFIASGLVTDISMQQIASCTSNPMHEGGFGGCRGGIPDVAFQSIIKNGGVASEWSYPYRSYYGTEDPCIFKNNKTESPVVKLSGFNNTISNDYNNFIDALANVGPFSIIVDAGLWKNYESGIFSGCSQTIRLDHAVQVVGYGSENGMNYWVVRNSWGAAWGEHGFIRIIRQQHPDHTQCDNRLESPICGACGILSYGAYPKIVQKH